MAAKRQFTQREKTKIALLVISAYASSQEYFGVAALQGIELDPGDLEGMHSTMTAVFRVWPELLQDLNPAGQLFKSTDEAAYREALQGSLQAG